MKNILVAILLTAVLFSMAVAIEGVTPVTRIPASTIGVGAIPTSTTRVAPFAAPTATPSGNVLASYDRNTGRVWMASVGDISSPSPDEVQIIFRGNNTRATGSDKYEAYVTVQLPEGGYVRKESGEIYVSVAIYDSAGTLVPLEGGGTPRLFGNPISFAAPSGSPNTRVFRVMTSDVLPAGSIYYVKAGFKVRSNQGGIHALGGGMGSDLSKGVLIKEIKLVPFYFG